MFGTSLTGFALGYWIYKETGSVSYYTLISVCTLLPNILISPIAGAVADRWDRRKIMIISILLLRWVLWRLLYYCGAVGLKSGTFIFPQLLVQLQARFRDRHFWRQLLKLRPNSILDRQTE